MHGAGVLAVHFFKTHSHTLARSQSDLVSGEIRLHGKFTTAAINEYSKLHAFGAAKIEQFIQRSAHAAAGIDHFITKHHIEVINVEGDVRPFELRHHLEGVQVIPILRDVDGTHENLDASDLFDLSSDALSQWHTARKNADQPDAGRALIRRADALGQSLHAIGHLGLGEERAYKFWHGGVVRGQSGDSRSCQICRCHPVGGSFAPVSSSRVAKQARLWFDASMQRFPRAVLMLAFSGLLASCDILRENKLLITAHVQTDEIEHPREIMKLPIGGQQMTFKKVPEFSQRSISAFEPFPDEKEPGFYGVVLQLDTKGRTALDLATRTYHGGVILTMVNALPIDMVEIDQPITDGRFIIWRGLSKKTIDEMDKFYPRLKYMKSSSRMMDDMLPSTNTEKINSRREAKALEAAEKAAEKAAARDKERGVVRPPPKTIDSPLEGYKLPGT